MNLAMLALLLIFAQPFPPLPRQTVYKQAEKITAKPQVSENRQNPTDPSPLIVVVNNCAEKNAANGAAKNEAYDLHAETKKQPQPWSRSEKLSLAYDILTGLLVVIALGTGVAVALQARESARATQAMQSQVAMQTETLRPRLTVGFDGSQFKPMTEGHAARMAAKVINTGGTPAYRVIAESWIEFLPMPFTQFSQSAEHFKGDPFSVHPGQPITYPVMRTSRLTDGEIKSTFGGTHCLCLRLRLTYEALGQPKFADFVLGAEPNGVATLRSEAN